MERIAKGSVHGRFQPFHNGHLDYVLQAFERADFISVGLTQIFKPLKTDAPGRNSPNSNPLTFQQRSNLIKAALVEAGIDHSRFEIVPFPIETSTRLREFIEPGTTCFTTELTPWNSEKIRLLKREGYEVHSLKVSEIDDLRVSTGTKIRAKIRTNDGSWEKLVPRSVAQLIEAHYLPAFKLPDDDTASNAA